MKKIISLFILLVFLYSCSSDPKKVEVETVTPKTEELVATISYEVVGSFPHDQSAYTEGLFIHNKQLYESTGAPADQPKYKTVIFVHG